MSWINRFLGRSECNFVRKEVLSNLPKSIIIEFIPEFDENGDPIIFIHSPEHENLISEARTNDEAIENAQDAILTYFDIPRECAVLIDFDIEDASQPKISFDNHESIRICNFKVKELANAQ